MKIDGRIRIKDRSELELGTAIESDGLATSPLLNASKVIYRVGDSIYSLLNLPGGYFEVVNDSNTPIGVIHKHLGAGRPEYSFIVMPKPKRNVEKPIRKVEQRIQPAPKPMEERKETPAKPSKQAATKPSTKRGRKSKK